MRGMRGNVRQSYLSLISGLCALLLSLSLLSFTSSALAADTPPPACLATSVSPAATPTPAPTPTPDTNPPRKILSGWIPYYSIKTAVPCALAHPELISEVTPFWYTLKDAKTIQDNYSAANPSLPIAGTIAQLKAASYLLLPTITDGTSTDPKTGKSIQLSLSKLLADSISEKSIINSITTLVTTNAYDGIDLDWESLAYVDPISTWSTTQPRWVAFISDLSAALHSQGKLLSVTTPPLFDPATGKKGYYLYAWSQIGSFIDRLRIMAYDYSTSSPGPIGPISWTESAVQYAISVMPASKVLVGIPGYGRDWVTKVVGTCPSLPINYLKTVSTTASAATFVMHDASTLAASYGATPTYQDKYGESTFTYQKVYNGTTADGSLTTCTATRTAWYQDAKGFALRAGLVAKYRLGGIAEWTFGMEDSTAIDAVRLVALSIAPDQVIATLTSTSSNAVIGDLISLTSSLKKKDTTSFVGIPLQIEMKASDGIWRPLDCGISKPYCGLSGADGSILTPQIIFGENTTLRAKSDGAWDRLPGITSELSINVSRSLSWNMPTSMKHGVSYTVSGFIQPRTAGVKISLDSQSPGTFKDQPSTITQDGGAFALTVAISKPGTYKLRAVASQDLKFAATQSDFVTVLVR